MSSVSLSVAGVNCGGCADTVTKALEAVAGVTSVAVSLDFVGGGDDGERALSADGKKLGTAVVEGEAELSALVSDALLLLLRLALLLLLLTPACHPQLAACEVAGKPAALSKLAAVAGAGAGALLFHLVPAADWAALAGADYFPVTYESDGFTHLTKDAELLLPVANLFYTDIAGDFIVLQCDPKSFAGEVKFEPAAPVGDKPTKKFSEGEGGDEPLFPHLYGCIEASSVVATIPVTRGEGAKGPSSFLAVDFDAIMYVRD